MSLATRIWVLLLLVSGVARAASDSPLLPSVTLEQALSYARAHQPQIRSALAELRARQAEAKIPRAAWMPRVGAVLEVFAGSNNDTTSVFVNVPEVDLARVGASGGRTPQTAAWAPSVSTLVAVSVNQQIYDFGRIAARAAVADAIATVAQADAEAAELDTGLWVEEAFHAVLAAHSVRSATEDAYRRAVVHRDYAQAGVKSGLRPPIDLTRAQAEVARLGVLQIRAQSGVHIARA